MESGTFIPNRPPTCANLYPVVLSRSPQASHFFLAASGLPTSPDHSPLSLPRFLHPHRRGLKRLAAPRRRPAEGTRWCPLGGRDDLLVARGGSLRRGPTAAHPPRSMQHPDEGGPRDTSVKERHQGLIWPSGTSLSNWIWFVPIYVILISANFDLIRLLWFVLALYNKMVDKIVEYSILV